MSRKASDTRTQEHGEHDMRRIPAALLAATLTLGGASAVFAAPGVDLPTQVADVLGLQEEDEGPEIEVEEDDEPSATALAKREGRGGDGDDSEEEGEGENADFVAFVEDLKADEELSGCERGAMISAVASSGRAGERDFDAADGADTSHCDRDEVTSQGDEPGQRGRDRAEEAKSNAGGDIDAQDEERGGPPEGKGKPETTGQSQSEGEGKPAHAGDGDDDEGLEEEQEEVEDESEEDDDDSDEDDGPPAHAGKPDGVGGGRPS